MWRQKYGMYCKGMAERLIKYSQVRQRWKDTDKVGKCVFALLSMTSNFNLVLLYELKDKSLGAQKNSHIA